MFATYTKEKDYDASGATKLPNFMYNQRVYWDVTPDPDAWVYSPVKYWPNGLDDKQTPAADGGDDDTFTDGGKVSFFAYAPYVTKAAADADASTGTGIIGMSANDANAHPTITYKMAATSQNVDLLWGTASTTAAEQSGDDLSGNKQAGRTLTGGKASVNVDLTKQQKDGRVRFLFKHALAKVGGSSKGTTPPTSGLQIKLDPDFGESFGAGAETVVTVDHIKISQNNAKTIDPPAYDHKKQNQGILDLATGIWTTSGEQDEFSQTIKAGASADNEAELNPNIKEKAVNTTIDLVTNTNWADATGGLVQGDHKGVLKQAQPVYDETKDVKPLLYFPGETPSLEVEIKYIVRTKDVNLAKGYSEVAQKIKKIVTFGKAVEMNKVYNLTIILGLTSVKFEATVADWETTYDNDGDPSNAEVSTEEVVNLPLNVN